MAESRINSIQPRNMIQNKPAKLFNLETDMDDGMLLFAKEIVSNKYDSTHSNQEIAQKLKDEFELKYYPTWICIVGKGFGCDVESEPGHYLRFELDNRVILLYKFK